MLARLVLLVFTSLSVSGSSQVADKQRELVSMLEQIVNRHLGITGHEIRIVDSDQAVIVQIFYPEAYSKRIVGQSGIFLRSLKILFNDMYLYAQELELGTKAFKLENAKKMHLRFIAKIRR